ncbi:MAG: hypothetical protein ABW277_15105 [Longimicrobiaceae bacterium]
MDATQLLEPVLSGGIRLTNFFNGRVLTAEDLRTDQHANRAQHRQLAAAVGEGVVHGFEVADAGPQGSAPVLRIQPGLAFNRDGDAVALSRAVELRLVTEAEAAAPEAGLFAVCQPVRDPLELTNVGLYVLTASPASGLSDERAPLVEPGGDGAAGACASRWALEGVRFAAVPLPLAAADGTPTPLALELAGLADDVDEDVDLVLRGGSSDTAALRVRLGRRLSRLRSGAAYLCFGADRLPALRRAPFPAATGFPDPRYGTLDAMREEGKLASCEVPLVLFHLTRRGVEWVDAWAVRRPVHPSLTAGALSPLPGERALAEALAMVLQFQQQLRELRESSLTQTALAAVEADEYFRFLPPLGMVPILGYGATRGLNLPVFFGTLAATQPAPLEGEQLPVLGAAALLQAPIDLSQPHALQLFRLTAAGASGRPPWVAFTRRGPRAVPEHDGVAQTLRDAWTVYRSLARRGVHQPMEAAGAGARIAIAAAVQDVLSEAARGAAAAAAGLLDRAGALAAYQALHDLQDELADLFRALDATLAGHQARQEFATVVGAYLATSIPGGGPGLQPALAAGSLFAAVRAQDAINNYVGSQGDTVAIGFISIRHTGSPQGAVLVPGSSTPFTHDFEVTNSTDRTVRIVVEADIAPDGSPPAGDWAGRVTVPRAGASTLGILVASGQSDTVAVSILPPSDAAAGEQVELRVEARVPAPNNQRAYATLNLQIGEEPGEPVTRTLAFPNVVGPPSFINLLALAAGQSVTFAWDIEYNATEEPLVDTFQFEIVPETPQGGWGVQIAGAQPGALNRGVLLTAGAQPSAHRTSVTFTAPTASGSTFTFHARVSSTRLNVAADSAPATLGRA